jgi:hypothetical protein
MPKKKPQARQNDPVERLARLLRDAHLRAYVAGNPTPHHPPAEWQEARHAGNSGWHQMARELIRLGLQPPREDAT